MKSVRYGSLWILLLCVHPVKTDELRLLLPIFTRCQNENDALPNLFRNRTSLTAHLMTQRRRKTKCAKEQCEFWTNVFVSHIALLCSLLRPLIRYSLFSLLKSLPKCETWIFSWSNSNELRTERMEWCVVLFEMWFSNWKSSKSSRRLSEQTKNDEEETKNALTRND